MLARVLAVIVCLSVCLVTCRYCIKTAKRRITQTRHSGPQCVAHPCPSPISANRKSTTRFPTSHRWTVYCTLPLTPPKGGTKHDFAILSSKCQSLCVTTSSGNVVATSFLTLTVHRWIAGDVPIHLKFALKVTDPRRKTPISTDFA